MSDSTDLPDRGAEITQVTNLARSSAELVKAELVRMHQSAAQEVSADEVELRLSAAAGITAEQVDTLQSALGIVEAGSVILKNSAAAGVRAEHAEVNGISGAVLADKAILGDTLAGVVAGNEVRAERINTVVLFGSHIEGEVHTVMDYRHALVTGLLGGLVGGLIFLLGRALIRRD